MSIILWPIFVASFSRSFKVSEVAFDDDNLRYDVLYLFHKWIEGESGGFAIEVGEISRIGKHIERLACYCKTISPTETVAS